MTPCWLIEFTQDKPTLYIAATGGLTYQSSKAKRFDSKEEAQAEIARMGLSGAWEAVSHHL
jgi:hypothetical protein